MKKILLLEDDQSFGYILSEYLQMQDFEIVWVKSGEEALKELESTNFSLAILDIMLQGISGFETAKIIKSNFPNIPFIFLSAKSLKIDKLKGFKIGAYDYITKPVDEEVLVAKINALLSRVNHDIKSSEEYKLSKYTFKPSVCSLEIDKTVVKLTARESELLLLLCQHKNELLPRKKALRNIWNSTDEFSRKSMDVFISHLRKYLSHDSNIKIENIHSKGFILKVKE